MKVEIGCESLALNEVFERLKPDIEAELLRKHDWLRGVTGFCWGSEEIEFEVMHLEDDPRVDGRRSEHIGIDFIRKHFTEADYYTWAKDEDGEPVLLCLY